MGDLSAPRLPGLVLFAESEGGWAVATGAGLRARGWSVVWASDAGTAAPVARRILPDVVIVDADLDGGGQCLLQHLRGVAATALIPAVGLVNDDEQRLAMEAAGVQTCLPKPATVDDLDAAAHEALEADVDVSAPPRELLADPGRLAALRTSGLLDAEPDDLFDQITGLAASLLPAWSARVSLVSDDQQVLKSRTDRPGGGDQDRLTPLTHSLCQWAVTSHEPMVVADARADPLLASNGAVTELGTVAYLGVPLLAQGQALGTLCVLDDQPREWDPDDLALVDALATVAAAEVRLRLAEADAADAGIQRDAAVEGVRALVGVLRRDLHAMSGPDLDRIAVLLDHFTARLQADTPRA